MKFLKIIGDAVITFLKSMLTIMMPQKNVICAYVGGAVCVYLVHCLTAANVPLTAAQGTEIGVGTAAVIAHIWDSIVKMQDSNGS